MAPEVASIYVLALKYNISVDDIFYYTGSDEEINIPCKNMRIQIGNAGSVEITGYATSKKTFIKQQTLNVTKSVEDINVLTTLRNFIADYSTSLPLRKRILHMSVKRVLESIAIFFGLTKG